MSPLGASSGLVLRRTTAGPPPTPDPPSGDFSLLGDPSFDTNDPTLRGIPLAGDALAVYRGLEWLMTNHKANRFVEQGGDDIDDLATSHLYQMARTLGTIYGEIALFFRLTGDLRILDEWARIASVQATAIEVGWPNATSAAPWPSHTYRCLNRYRGVSGEEEYYGTDHNLLDNIRAHEPLAHLLYALRLNQHLASPAHGAGYYEAQADFWETYFLEWLRVWSGPEEKAGRNQNGSTASGWSVNYRGQQHNYYYSQTGKRRADYATWPVVSRHLTHTHIGASTLHYWLGKAMGATHPGFAQAAAVGLEGIEVPFLDRNMYYWNGLYGEQGVWPRALQDTGHYTTSSPGLNYSQPSMYIAYIVHNLFNLWLEGVMPRFKADFAVPVARTMNAYLFRDLSSSQGMHMALLGSSSLTGSSSPKRRDGKSLPIIAYSGTIRSNANLVSSAVCMMQAFDTDDDYMEHHIWDARMGSSSSFYRTSGTPVSRPRVMSPGLGLLMKLVNARDWTP